MAHFGKHLASLREQRGLTQQKLADLVGISTPTIYRAEAAASSPLRRSTATDILLALHRVARVPDDQARAYLIASGLTEEFLQTLDKITPPVPPDPVRRSADPLTNRAFDLVTHLCARVGSDRLVTALESLAIAWGAGVPAAEVLGGGTVRLVEKREEDGVAVTIYSPPPTRPPTAPKAKPKRGAS